MTATSTAPPERRDLTGRVRAALDDALWGPETAARLLLVQAGLARLESRGIRTAALYVDADNEAAVRLYRSCGFGDHTIDVQYRREG